MGVYQYDDPKTGQGYDLRIVGDVPTEEEFARLAGQIRQDRSAFLEDYEQQFGTEIEFDDGTALGRSSARGYQQVKGAIGETIGTIGEQTGLGFLERYGTDVEERARQKQGLLSLTQPKRMQSTDVDSFGSMLTFAGETIGEQGTQLGLGLGAAALGTIAAPVVAPVLGAAAPFVAGATVAGLATAPILFGNNIQRQEDEVAAGTKDRVDVGDALAATFGQAALEGVADKLLLGGFKLLKPMGSGKTGWKGLLTRTTSRVGTGGSTEGLTEIGQQMLERAQAGLPIDSEDAIAEYREAGIAGFLIGGPVRATGLGERGGRTPKNKAVKAATSDQYQTQKELDLKDPLDEYRELGREDAAKTGLFTNALDQKLSAIKENVGQEAADAYEKAAREQVQVNMGERAAKEREGQGQVEPILNPKLREGQEQGELFQEASDLPPAPPPVTEGQEQGELLQEATKEPEQGELFPVTPTVVTEELLNDLGVHSESSLRDPNKKASIIGKDLSDKDVQDKLEEFRDKSKAPKKIRDKVNALLGGINDGVAADARPTDGGAGESISSGRDRLEAVGRQETELGSSEGFTTSDADAVGGSGRDAAVSGGPDGSKSDTLADDYVGDAIWANADFDVPVTVLDERAQPAEDGSLFKKVRGADGQEAFVPFAQLRAVKPKIIAPEDVEDLTKEVDAVVTKPVVLDAMRGRGGTQIIPGTKVPTDPTTLAPIGKPVLQDDPLYAPPASPVATVQGASVPQAQLQAAEDTRNQEAEVKLNALFEDGRRSAQAQEYHDTQLDPRSAPEVTTAVDKEGIVELLNTSDADLKDDAPALAAKTFFKRFRRPVDALAEIGATVVIGPTQNIKKDFTPAQFAFYNGMTQPAAMDARRWVHANMSRGAILEMIDARRIATRGNYNANVIDAPNKNRNAMQKLENTSVEEIVDGIIIEEAVTEATENDVIGKPLDQSMRADKVPSTIKNRVGHTKLEALLATQGFEKTKVRSNAKLDPVVAIRTDTKGNRFVYKDTRNEGEFLSQEEYNNTYDDIVYTRKEMGLFLLDPVHGLDQALLPSIRNALQRGDLQFALNAIAATSPVQRVRQIAGKLAEVVGTTQVQVADDLSQMVGRKAAGLFSPKTNTIFIDANNGMNVHTILHEMTHAATSVRLANPALPETRQLTNLLNLVRKEFGDVRGTANIDEFVAEAFSNPEFQSVLALIKLDDGKVSGWEKFTGAVRRIVRKVIGLKPKSPESALDEVDRIINGMLTPSPATRAAPSLMLAASTPKGSMDLAKSAVAAVPSSKRAEYVEMASDVVYNARETGGDMLKNVVRNSLDSRILADVAKKKIPFAPELNVMIRKMSGAMRNRSDKLDAITNNYAAWARKNKAAAKLMNNIIPKSTQLRVDPSMPRSFYSSYKTTYHDLTTKKAVVKEFKSEKARLAWVQNFNANVDEKKTTKAKNMKDPDPQDLVAYDALRKQYNAMGKEGQAFYRQMRNFFQDTYDEIVPALRTRLEATIQDPNIRASAFEKLSDILMKESGLIRPYFPLMRKGKHRLQYNFIDENGQLNHSVEYFQNRRELDRAFKLAEQDIARNVKAGRLAEGTKPAYTRADQPMNFKAVPSSSFVYDILKNMQMSKGSFRDKNGRPDNKAYEAAVQSVVDLALDAMPERSFMQNFRRRGDVRGYIGDTTPTKIGDTEFDAATMMREKGRDLNRQIVQIQSAAEIEGFRNKLKEGGYLDNPETADVARKLDRMAAFAQKPDVPRWSQQLNAIGFNMTMGLNFSSAAITFFDVAMSAMPIISAEYGVVNTGRAYREAMTLITNAPKTRGIMVTGPDGKPIEQEVKMGIQGKSMFNYLGVDRDQLPASEQAIRLDVLLETASDQGQANQSLTQESLEIGRDAPLEGVNKWTSAMFHHSERVNRETTLRASYALEVRKLQAEGRQLTDQDYKDAAQKAIETTEFTLGSTSAAGRPIYAQSGFGNVVFLFKRFAIAKYYMMYKLGHDSIGTTNIERIMQEQGVTEAEAQQIATDRKIARIGLRNFMVSTGIMAGVGGMPMMGAIGAIVNTLIDNDEDDFESQIRKFTGEGIYGGLANLIFDAEISSRISLNSLLYRPPFIEKDQSPIWTFAEQMGGPVVGIANSTIRGGTEMWEGLTSKDNLALWRGTETVLPSALRNFAKGFRYYNDGATTRRNDAVIEDISLYNALMQGAGFAPAEYVRELDYNRNIMRRKKTVNERRAKLNKRYNMAKMAGDVDEMRKLIAMQKEFNRGLPEVFADREITRETRKKSYDNFVRNSGNARGGVIHTEAMKQIRDEYNQGFQGL